MIQAYFAQVKVELDRYTSANFVLDASINFETRPGNQGLVSGQVLFIDGSRFFFREYLDALAENVDKLMYSYHYQDSKDLLIFRYNNAFRKPASNFQEHKHTSPDQIEHAASPTISDTLAKIAIQQGWV